MISNSEAVKIFTEESMNIQLPKHPQKMSKDEVKFIVRMVCSELSELCTTVTDSTEEAVCLLKECVEEIDRPKMIDFKDEKELIANQYDAFVDSWYYMLNASCKKGVDLDGIFRVVHEANMAKRFSDGKFHRREDGKVLKPENWKEPDIVAEIERQMLQ
jgi:predicted HAD superfamily Cof-like phosphohydrolase